MLEDLVRRPESARSRRRSRSPGPGGGECSVDEEQRRMETMKVHFELLKHITTLDTASALIVVAIYRDINANPIATALALVAFGLSLVVAVYGMIAVNAQIRLAPMARRRRPEPRHFYQIWPPTLFVIGVFVFVYGYVVLFPLPPNSE